jgi:hypothetical protein
MSRPNTIVAGVVQMRPQCTACGGFLASDNTGPTCSPCWRSQLLRTASSIMPFTYDRAELEEVFEADGLDGLAARLRSSRRDALDVALANGLVPAGYRRRVDVLRPLLEMDDISHVDAARQLGLSRWTVASYRRDLRLSTAGRIAA